MGMVLACPCLTSDAHILCIFWEFGPFSHNLGVGLGPSSQPKAPQGPAAMGMVLACPCLTSEAHIFPFRPLSHNLGVGLGPCCRAEWLTSLRIATQMAGGRLEGLERGLGCLVQYPISWPVPRPKAHRKPVNSLLIPWVCCHFLFRFISDPDPGP